MGTAATNLDTSHLILQVVGVLLGGGALQLIIFLLKRRAELRKLDVQSDVGLLGSAQTQITTLLASDTQLRTVIANSDQKNFDLEARLLSTQKEAARALDRIEQTVARLQLELSQSNSELTVAKLQVQEFFRNEQRMKSAEEQNVDMASREPSRHRREEDDNK